MGERARALFNDSHAFRLLVKEMKDYAIFFMDLDGIIQTWNEGAERIKGYTEEEAVGRFYGFLFTEEDIEKRRPQIELGEAKNKGRFEEDDWRRHKSGRCFWAHVTLTPHYDEDGNHVGYVKITQDITDRKEHEDEIKRLSEQKDEFIAVASHELKTPLTSVKAYTQLVQKLLEGDDNCSSKASDMVSKVEKNITKLNVLIDELLDISRIQSGKLRFSFSDFDLDTLVKETIEAVQTTVKHTIKFKGGTGMEIHADQYRIEQALVNLLTNAVRYSPDENEVLVETKVKGDEVVFSVKDYGVGIPKENQERLFERFYRADNVKTKINGLGIGLYITYKIIQAHKGKVWLESEEGKGSTFYFCLPLNGKS